jgi:murein DD-endopeptidase MepM/ murein hydrolase activator NlpD
VGRPLFDLHSLRGLLLCGLLAGTLLAASLAAWPLLLPSMIAEEAPSDELRERGLTFPVAGIARVVTDTFTDRRGSARLHHAVDIMAARGTPVRAVDEGTIVKLGAGGIGGTTIYQHDAADQYCYYYAHLQGYASGLREGQKVGRGEVIASVGTTGNAPANAPHLHFAIYRLDDRKDCSTGTPVNPFPLLR